MDTVELLAKFADPEMMKTLTAMERLMAGLITTVLGMGITFVALVVLQFVIGILAKFSVDKPQAIKAVEVEAAEADISEINNEAVKDEEIVAAITTALALQLQTSVSNIVIRNIEKVNDSSSAWQKAGLAEHMNTTV